MDTTFPIQADPPRIASPAYGRTPRGPDGRRGELEDSINQVVGTLFFGTLLKTMRNSALRGSVGHGGYGEQVFNGQLDLILAERTGRATPTSLGAALLDRLAPQQQRIDAYLATRQENQDDDLHG